MCHSYSKVEASALSSTPKFEGGSARDLHGARVARRVKSRTRQRQNIGACAILTGIIFQSVVAGVSEPWLQAHPNDPVESQFPYWCGRRYCAALHNTTILNSARERMSPRHPQQRLIPFLRCYDLCLNLNELQTCRTGDTVCIFLYMMAYYVECTPLDTLECILIDEPRQSSPENACARWREIDYIQM